MTETLIQLFAKAPIPGQVKTRLIPELGEKGANEVYLYCLQHNLDWLNSCGQDVQVWLDQPSGHALFNGLNIQLQQGRHLGEKMFHALSSELRKKPVRYRKVILIGSDCLDLTPALLQRVDCKLDQSDLVFIPAEDGGYVLIAARNDIDPILFENIDWGSNRVMRQTLDRIRKLGLSVILMNPLRDIDRWQDLKHYPQLNAFIHT